MPVLAEVLSRAVQAPFWRQRLAEAGDAGDRDRRSALERLRALPVLTRDDLFDHGPPHSEAMLTGALASAYVFRTGGTTGHPKFSVFSSAEFRAMVEPFVLTYRAAGLEPADRVANTFTVGSLYASFVFVNRCLEEMGVVNLPYTMSAPPELVASQWDLFGLTALMGFPSHLMSVVKAIGPGKIRKLFYAGEHLHAPDRRILTEEYGIAHIASGGYGAVDTGLMGYQCRAATGSEHHVLVDHAVVEIVDAETLEPVSDGEPGRVLITCLDRLLMPMIRYDIGDRARWLAEPCPCGRPEPRFELLGRGGDALRIGIANVGHDEIALALQEVAAVVQIVKERHDGSDRLLVRYEPRSAQQGAGGRRAPDELSRLVLAAKPDLAKMVAAGQIAPVVVQEVPAGALPRSPLTGKQIKVEDRSVPV